jgi:murein DD-endopeptidase MepM/ murein hydrolase activator NlpD
MRLSTAAIFMIFTTVFLSGCDSANVASVDERGGNFYGRQGVVASVSSRPASLIAQAPFQSRSHASVALTTPQRAVAQAPLAANTWQWPVQGEVVETYGQKSDGVANEGIVIAAAEGTPIRAAQAGEVAFVGKDTKTYGNIVIVRHGDGDMTSYSHAREISVTKGERVNAGATLGHVGQSGKAASPQLHFAVRQGQASVDPLSKLPHHIASN